VGKVTAFENAVKAHVAKFHTTDRKAYVYEILSGPNSGSYLWAEGPMSFEDVDNRKRDPAHDADWEATCAPHIEKYGENIFSRRRDSLCHGSIDLTIEKSQSIILSIKPGKMDQALELRKKIKEAYEKTGDKRNVTVYTKLFAGSNPQMIIIVRYPTGWKEMEEGYYASLPDLFKKAFGEDAKINYERANDEVVESAEQTLRIFRKDLSSK